MEDTSKQVDEAMPAQSASQKLGASMLLGMLECVEIAQRERIRGSSVICGGGVLKVDEWTPVAIAKGRKICRRIIDAPDAPDNIWHDRIVKPRQMEA